MLTYTTYFILSFILVYLLIPVFRRGAVYVGMVDHPGGRKMHEKPVPLSGGVAIFAGIMLVLWGWTDESSLIYVLATGGIPLVLAGIIDDWFKSKGKDFPALIKLLVQLSSGLVVYLGGVRLEGISNFLGLNRFPAEFIPFPGWLSLLTTILWITAMINMINFLDGVDGLAGGVTVISGMTLFLVAFVRGQTEVAVLSAVVVGGSLAFLRYNFYPATVFLGDAGSMFLGYILGFISLYGAVKSATLFTIGITVLALGVPVLDTMQVLITRFRQGVPVYRPDRQHMHHRLLKRGLNPKQTVYVLYLASLFFSILSLLLVLFIF
ncbi:MAG: undecaprenyl/decaprenyl-phosphate alpha-N-acetylglucosaminyl 1-phosphate transferase [Bacillaceae bacterium]|nr:undecaprenyl/decaprenyl-phosphate alpha-N-acetylglucosaminyl 1-phosphate transferase [Bacillaceae bacterium]